MHSKRNYTRMQKVQEKKIQAESLSENLSVKVDQALQNTSVPERKALYVKSPSLQQT